MQDENVPLSHRTHSDTPAGPAGSAKDCARDQQFKESEAAGIRAARAKLIEETTYRLTDLFTIISGRVEILSEKVPDICRQELLAIREVLARGVELNRRLYLTAQACRREIGRPLSTAEIMNE